jgi:NtrC-family two-component system sensor histidine kinase KinB
MNLKTKITLGFVVMFVLLGGVGAYSLYALRQLDLSASNILKDNFYSVQLGQQLYGALDQLAPTQQRRYLGRSAPTDSAAVQRGLRQFQQSMAREAGNLTEPGEREVVDSLTHTFAAYQQLLAASAATPRTAEFYLASVLPQHQLLRAQTAHMVALNMTALTRKNAVAARTADQAMRSTLALLAVSSLVMLIVVLRVPASVVAPLRKLLASLHKASQQDFTSTIPAGGLDELGQVARAFNHLLEQLQDYRTSTVAQLRAERNRLASVVNALDEGLLVVDEHRRIIVANPVASRSSPATPPTSWPSKARYWAKCWLTSMCPPPSARPKCPCLPYRSPRARPITTYYSMRSAVLMSTRASKSPVARCSRCATCRTSASATR